MPAPSVQKITHGPQECLQCLNRIRKFGFRKKKQGVQESLWILYSAEPGNKRQVSKKEHQRYFRALGRPKTAKHRACGVGKISSRGEAQSVGRLKSGQVSVGEGYTPLPQYCIDENDLFYHLNCSSVRIEEPISLIPELKNPAPKIAKFLDFYGCLTSMLKNNMHSEDSCF